MARRSRWWKSAERRSFDGVSGDLDILKGRWGRWRRRCTADGAGDVLSIRTSWRCCRTSRGREIWYLFCNYRRFYTAFTVYGIIRHYLIPREPRQPVSVQPRLSACCTPRVASESPRRRYFGIFMYIIGIIVLYTHTTDTYKKKHRIASLLTITIHRGHCVAFTPFIPFPSPSLIGPIAHGPPDGVCSSRPADTRVSGLSRRQRQRQPLSYVRSCRASRISTPAAPTLHHSLSSPCRLNTRRMAQPKTPRRPPARRAPPSSRTSSQSPLP